MNFEIPDGLTDLLQDFTVEVLRKRPGDLLAFAAQYFEELLEKRVASSDQDASRSPLLKQHGNQATNGNELSSPVFFFVEG
jgi:cAMP-dependent protein kinase regulator